MKLAIKAYKCHLPIFFTYSYGESLWDDSNLFQTIYGKSQKEAVKILCKKAPEWGYTFFEIKSCIRTKRYPEKDYYSQEASPLLDGLTENEIGHITHSLGVRVGGYCPEEFYRNYSMYYEVNPEFYNLVERGLMDSYIKNGSHVYYVTDKGIGAVKTLLLVQKNRII